MTAHAGEPELGTQEEPPTALGSSAPPMHSCIVCAGLRNLLLGCWPATKSEAEEESHRSFIDAVKRGRSDKWEDPASPCIPCKGTGKTATLLPEIPDGHRAYVCFRCKCVFTAPGGDTPQSCPAERGGCGRLTDETRDDWTRIRAADDTWAKRKARDPSAVAQLETPYHWTIHVSDDVRIEGSPKGVDRVHELVKGGEDVRPVLRGPFRPRRRLIVEEVPYFEVDLGEGIIVRDTADGIRKRLDAEARIVAHSCASDVVNSVLYDLAGEVTEAHPCFGVYSDSAGRLRVAREFHAVKPLQIEEGEAIRAALEFVPTRESLEDYIEFLRCFNQAEVLPLVGSSGIGSVAHELRRHRVMVCHTFSHSPEPGLGKSMAAGAFSTKVYGRQEVTGDQLNSDFRFLAIEDAICTPVPVEESERIDPVRRGSDIKNSAERAQASARGNADKSVTSYKSRTIFFFTANSLPFTSEPTLARLLVLRYDASRRSQRADPTTKMKVDSVYRRLKPIGAYLAETVVRLWPTADEILCEIRELEVQISKCYGGVFGDVRRAQAWATVYAGLKVWAAACKGVGVQWEPPAICDFIREVVRPVERATFESRESPLDAFALWWQAWRSTNTIVEVVRERESSFSRRVPKGHGEMWDDHTLFVDRGDKKESLSGTVVTRAVLKLFNERLGATVRIGSLRELALEVSQSWAIPPELLLREDGPGVYRIGPRTVRAAFVPDGDPPEPDPQLRLPSAAGGA